MNVIVLLVCLQVVTGAVQPLILSLMSGSALAKMGATYPLPPAREWRTLMRVYITLLRPFRIVIFGALAANIVNAAVLTYGQGKAALRVHEKMTESHFFIS